jgi:hypothetical protein
LSELKKSEIKLEILQFEEMAKGMEGMGSGLAIAHLGCK